MVMAPTNTLEVTSEVTLVKGLPYVRCGQCNGTGDNGTPPFCDECFGSGQAPLGTSAIRAARLGEDLSGYVESYRNQFAGGRGSCPTASNSSHMANQYPGTCIKCGGHVAANAGWRTRDGQKWCTQHRIGECPVVTEATTVPANVRSNKYPGPCAKCGSQVAGGAGQLLGSKGNYTIEHIVCPVAEIIVQSLPTMDPIVARLAAVIEFVPADNKDFAESLVEQYGRKGRLSDKQMPYVEKYAVAGEKVRDIEILTGITQNILARTTGRASLRFAIPSGGHNSLDFLCVFKGRMERHVGAPGQVRKIPLAAAQAITLATRIMDLDDEAFNVASSLYGTAMHKCGRCGSPLTDDTSKAQGYGPECIHKVGF